MKQAKYLLVLLVGIALLAPTVLTAQINFNGGRGLTYVQSAWSLDQGYLTLTSQSRIFGKSKTTSLNAFTVWDISGRFQVNYGLNKNVEVSISPTLYQDTNAGPNKVNSFDALFLSAKYGSITSPGSSTAFGVQVKARLPLGDNHNLPFEAYASDKVAFGLTGLFSYSRDPLYPEGATNFHANLTYWNHNDVGVELVSGNPATAATSASQEILYGFGVKVPNEKFEFSAELYGNAFLKSPPAAAYSRESYMYLSPGISYTALSWLSVNFGADLRLFEGSDKTLYAPAAGGISPTFANSQPNYSSWRLNFGTKFNLRSTRSYRMDERELLMQKAQSRRQLFEQIIKEQKDTEAAQVQLERIKEERIRAEKELERLRRILEGETKEGSEKKDEKGKN